MAVIYLGFEPLEKRSSTIMCASSWERVRLGRGFGHLLIHPNKGSPFAVILLNVLPQHYLTACACSPESRSTATTTAAYGIRMNCQKTLIFGDRLFGSELFFFLVRQRVPNSCRMYFEPNPYPSKRSSRVC
jgi:hypothetical protein